VIIIAYLEMIAFRCSNTQEQNEAVFSFFSVRTTLIVVVLSIFLGRV